MFFHLFRLATMAKGALALSLVAGAYGAGSSDVQEYRVRTTPVHVEATLDPAVSAQPATTTEPPSSFEALLQECVARYSRAAENTKDACERAMAASGLGADAFWAKYRSLLVPPAAKTDKPVPATSFEALLSECVARYRRGADNTKEACDRAIAASGLTTEAFVARYRSLLVAPTAKPTSSPKPASTDPAVKECLARYETLKAMKTGPADVFEAALHTFNETCRGLLVSTTAKPTSSPKPASTAPAAKECLAKYETLKTRKTGPADAFEAALRTFNETCRTLLVPSSPKPTSSPKPASTAPAVKECLARYETLKTLKTGPADAFDAALRTFNETCKRVLEGSR